MAASLGTRPLYVAGKSELDGRTFKTFYDGFRIGKDIAHKRGECRRPLHPVEIPLSLFLGDGKCLGYRVDRQSDYQWVTYSEVGTSGERCISLLTTSHSIV